MKIQILELPMEHVGQYSRTPYALIASEVPAGDVISTRDQIRELTKSGPSWIWVTSEEVEI